MAKANLTAKQATFLIEFIRKSIINTKLHASDIEGAKEKIILLSQVYDALTGYNPSNDNNPDDNSRGNGYCKSGNCD